MTNETVFYVVGLALVVAALVLAAVGLRIKSFPPSKGIMGTVIGIFALLVAATAVYGWRNAEDEQTHREAELAAEAAENEEAGDEIEADEEVGGEATTAASADGAAVFEANGCGGCHTLAAAGSSGTTGPDLDGALKGKTTEFIRTSIVDPNAEIERNYPPDVMPQAYGTDLASDELDALVEYLATSTGAKD